MCEIRLLRADEIDVRAQQVKENGAVLLLYKDARCDMAILDETFGMLGWQRRHEFKDGNNYCTVSVWNSELAQWITKEDVGTESNTDKEKGQASDAFKRACFNIGIGRELYTAPFIWVNLAANEVFKDAKTGRCSIKGVKFAVSHIEYDDKRAISALEIVDGKGNVRFSTQRSIITPAQPEQKKKILTRDMFADEAFSIKVCEWIDKNNHKAQQNGERFSIHSLLDQHYNLDNEMKAYIAGLYLEYKQLPNDEQ